MKKKGYGTHPFVEIPWPLPPAVDGSTRRVVRSRAAARGSELGTRHGCVGRAPPTNCLTAAHPPIGGRAHRREGRDGAILLRVARRPTSRSRLDPLGYGSVEEPLDGGASTHRRARAPARRPAAAPSRGELRRAAVRGAAREGANEP
jgi:hypothetical protein